MQGKSMTKIVISSTIASAFEWYDFALYGYSAIIISKLFFPNDNLTVALLNTFGAYAAGFMMRPLGAMLFGIIGDKYGRKQAISLSIFLMALPTGLIGILPDYSQIGLFAPIFLTIIRLMQGLSLGGTLGGSMAFLSEHSPVNKRGLISSMPLVSACIGMLIGSLMIGIVASILPVEEFEKWGWRIPFLVGVLVVFAGFYVRKHLEESPLFEKAKALQHLTENPLITFLKSHKKLMLLSIGISCTECLMFYGQAVYIGSYLEAQRNFGHSFVQLLNSATIAILGITAIFAGKISDHIGRKTIYKFTIPLVIITIIPIFMIVEQLSSGYIIAAQIVFSMIAGLYMGPDGALQAEIFPTSIRCSGVAISYNIANTVFGGFMPFCATWLVAQTNTIKSVGFVIAISAVISLITLRFIKDRSKEELDFIK